MRTGRVVALFERTGNAGLELLSETEEDYYGTCPCVGDKIYWPKWAASGGPMWLLIVERSFMDGWSYQGWALIAERIDPSLEMRTLAREWNVSKRDEKRREAEEQSRQEAEYAAVRAELDDKLSRSADAVEREKYPRLLPKENEYKAKREFPDPKAASPIQPPLESWEKRAMNFLLEFKPDKLIPVRAVDGLGASTINSLQARGYIVIESSGRATKGATHVRITEKAINDVQADKDFRIRYIPSRRLSLSR